MFKIFSKNKGNGSVRFNFFGQVKREDDRVEKKDLAEYNDRIKEEKQGAPNISMGKAEIKESSFVDKRREKKMAGPIETNLIEGEVITYFNYNEVIISLVFMVFFAIALIGGVYAYLIFYEKIKNEEFSDIDRRLASIELQNQQLENEADEISRFQKKLKIASILLSRHVYWSNFFQFLEDNTLPETTYNGFSGDLSGKYGFSATTDSFLLMAKQLKVLKENKLVKEVQVAEGSSGGEGQSKGTTFNLGIVLDTSIFKEYQKTN